MPDKATASTQAGQAIYTPAVLSIYDLWVLGFSNRFLWRCPTAKLRALYDRNVSENHLDIGVGSGYFLKHACWPAAAPEITLFDLNPHSLETARQRIRHLSPKTIAGDILAPLPAMGPFQSVAMCYLMHCLPGSMGAKARAFDNVAQVMAPGARLFGATILQGDTRRSAAAQRLMDIYNRRGIFSNANDDVAGLQSALDDRFSRVRVELQGCVALFEAEYAPANVS